MSFKATLVPAMTQAQELTKDFPLDAIGRKIEHDQGGKAAKLGDLSMTFDDT